jgi:hypothetical protein
MFQRTESKICEYGDIDSIPSAVVGCDQGLYYNLL